MIARADFVAAVRSLVGTPYRHRGRLAGIACDCIGVPILALRACGITIDEPAPYGTVPSGLREGLARYCDEVMVDEAAPGDLLAVLWAGEPRHVAVLVDPGRIVHARASTGRVVEQPLTRGYMINSAWRIRGIC